MLNLHLVPRSASGCLARREYGGGGRHQQARYGGERQDLGHCDLLFV